MSPIARERRLELAISAGWAVVITVAVSSVVIGLTKGIFDPERTAVSISAVAFVSVGAILAGRIPNNVIGWIFIVFGALLSVESFVRNYIDGHPTDDLPWGGLILAFLVSKGFLFYLVFLGILFLTFPSGRLDSPRASAIRWGLVAPMFVAGPAWYLRRGELDDEPPLSRIDNPYALESGFADPLEIAGYLATALLFAALIVAAYSMIGRFRRATGVLRLQLKWFAAGTGAVIIALSLAALGWIGLVRGFGGEMLQATLSLMMGAIPVSAGVAVMRYRLYEIDFLINRTLVYGSLSVLLAVSYLGLVFGLQLILGDVTQDSQIAVAASTLAVAALFRPLRDRVQSFIDRRFYRRKYDAHGTLERFGVKVRNEVHVDEVAHELMDAVAVTVAPSHAGLWVAPTRELIG